MNVEFVKPPSAPPALDLRVATSDRRLDVVAGELAQAQAEVDRLRLRLSRPRAAEGTLPRLAAMLRACGEARPGSFAFAAGLARIELEHRCGRLDLPAAPAAARLSMVLSAGDFDETVASLRSLAPMLLPCQAELLVADDSCEPGLALLAATLRQLRVISAGDAATACNLAVSAARGKWVAWVEGAPAADCWPDPAPDEVLVGPAATLALARFGVSLGDPAHRAVGLRVAAPRLLWNAAGGLDAAMDDGSGLALADLCLKLRLLGASLTPVAGTDPAPRRSVSPGQVWQAVAGFRARWGEILAAETT